MHSKNEGEVRDPNRGIDGLPRIRRPSQEPDLNCDPRPDSEVASATTPLAKHRVVVVDTETTGLNPGRDQIIELAILEGLLPGGTPRLWRFKPTVPVSPGALAIHGIGQDLLDNCPPFGAAAAEIRQALEKAEVIVGFKLPFDLEFLRYEFQRVDLELRLEHKSLIDVHRLWNALEPRSLKAAHERFARSRHPAPHTAGGDVTAIAQILAHMLPCFSLEGESPERVAALCKNPSWIGTTYHVHWENGVPVLGFGKYKGRTLLEVASVEPDYLSWIVEGSNELPIHVKEIAKLALSHPSEGGFATRVAERFGGPPNAE